MKTKIVFAFMVIFSILFFHKQSFSQIEGKYNQTGGKKGFLGKPVTEVLWTPDHSGKFQQFKGGNIYWKDGIGAFAVHDKILGKYGDHNYEQGVLGYPLTDVLWTPDRSGKFQRFEGGIIYWKKKIGAFVVHGDILNKYRDLHFEQGILGYPITDEMDLGDGRGKCVEFQKGVIYWTPETGAHEMHGIILEIFTKGKGVKHPASGLFKRLGYPITDVKEDYDGLFLRVETEKGGCIWGSPSPEYYRISLNDTGEVTEYIIDW